MYSNHYDFTKNDFPVLLSAIRDQVRNAVAARVRLALLRSRVAVVEVAASRAFCSSASVANLTSTVPVSVYGANRTIQTYYKRKVRLIRIT